jgi:hypothetical protein
MGIYSDGKIYGISLVSSDIIIYEKKYPYEMGLLEINEAADLYKSLSDDIKASIRISFYCKSSTTYEPTVPNEFMHWFPVDKDVLEKYLINAERG